MTRYVIVGSGVAAMSAVEAIRSVDAQGEIVLVSDDPWGFYSRPGLAYYLTDEIPESQLFPQGPAPWSKWRVRRIWGRVQRIDPASKHLEIAQWVTKRRLFGRTTETVQRTVAYDRLLLALGSQAVRPPIAGLDLDGVFKLDDLADARRILTAARRAKQAVVIGGGITSLELVEGLLARGVKVHYLMRGDRYWASVLEEDESRLVEQRLKEEGVRLYHHAEVAEAVGKKGRLRAVRLKDGREIRCDLLAYAIGVRPRKALAEQAGLQVDRGILVDEYLTTSLEGIYAAGDVAQVYDPRQGKAVLDSLWTPARRQGYFAGLNMAGARKPYRKGVPFNVTRLAGLTTTIIGIVGGREEDTDTVGIVRGDSETWRETSEALVAQQGFDVNRVRLHVGERTILGAVIMGDQTLSLPLEKLITQEVDITPIRDRLLQPHAPLADLIIDFWHAWQQSRAA